MPFFLSIGEPGSIYPGLLDKSSPKDVTVFAVINGIPQLEKFLLGPYSAAPVRISAISPKSLTGNPFLKACFFCLVRYTVGSKDSAFKSVQKAFGSSGVREEKYAFNNTGRS